MMYAKINNGQLVTANIIKTQAGTFNANSESPAIPEGWQLVESGIEAEEISKGFPTLTPAQFSIALMILGVSESDAITLIDSIPDASQKAVARIYYNKAQVYYRDNVFIRYIIAHSDLTDDLVDAAWMQAVLEKW